MQKPPSPHRWGLAHSFRSEREEGGARGVQGGGRDDMRSGEPLGSADPGARPRPRPRPRPLTHARAPPGANVQAVASVAVAIVGTAGVHADAPPGAARLRLAFVHV